jgi:ubiquinone/menaquinone biosynthesis C-methylase UbiE
MTQRRPLSSTTRVAGRVQRDGNAERVAGYAAVPLTHLKRGAAMTPRKYGDSLFEGTAHYYAQFRPGYPHSLVEFLREKADLSSTDRVLDLGTGTGQVVLALAPYVASMVAMDPDAEMLAEARRRAADAGITNVEWRQGSSEDLPGQLGHFRLITIGSAYHWMDREETARRLYEMLEKNGVLVILGNRLAAEKEWHKERAKTVEKWLGTERRAGESTYEHPTVLHEEVVAQSAPFNVEKYKFGTYEQTLPLDAVVGYLYSTSFASRRLLGGHLDEFERDLRSSLLHLVPDGQFSEDREIEAIVARRRESNR